MDAYRMQIIWQDMHGCEYVFTMNRSKSFNEFVSFCDVHSSEQAIANRLSDGRWLTITGWPSTRLQPYIIKTKFACLLLTDARPVCALLDAIIYTAQFTETCCASGARALFFVLLSFGIGCMKQTRNICNIIHTFIK